MSIAAGFVCSDGLVVCADTQIGTDQFKYYESKIFPINLSPASGAVLLAYAGLPAIMKVIHEDFRKRVEDQTKTCSEVRVHLQETLESVLTKESSERHQMLCAICDGESRILLKTENQYISPVPWWDCVGFGDSALTRYLVGIFWRSGLGLSIEQAEILCAYLIAQAKKYVQWVGGYTNITALTENGTVRPFYWTEAQDADFDIFEYVISRLVNVLANRRSSGGDCGKAINDFSRYLIELRAKWTGRY